MTYHRNLGRITAQDAERETDRLAFTMPEAILPDLGTTPASEVKAEPRHYAAKLYTIDAIDPDGFPVHFSFADISIEQFEAKKAQMKAMGYTPPSQAPAAAAPVATPDDLPEGWKLCQKHKAPMRPRNKQNQNWHSHNVGTKERPVWCKGYKGADSPGYDVE